MALVKLDIHVQKNEVRPLLCTIYKNQFEMDQRPNHRSYNYKTLEENTGRIFMTLYLAMISRM